MTEPNRSMMYSTPTLDRRPRPPGAVPHRAIFNGNRDSPSGSNSFETPLSRQLHARRHDASPVMEHGDEVHEGKMVGLGLSSSLDVELSSRVTKDRTDHESKQPSPPPPYGPTSLSSLASVSTPPTQDVDDDPLDHVHTESTHEEDEEEEQRRERATDLAKSLGLALLTPPKLSREESVEEFMDAEQIRTEMRLMKRRLKVRDHELVMAAQAADLLLRQNEELVSALPTHIRGLLPQLHDLTTPLQSFTSIETGRILDQSASSSSSPVLHRSYTEASPVNSPSRSPGKRLFRTVRTSDISKPFPHHHHKQSRNIFNTPQRTSFAETQQQESDERLILLEKALAESRENEETQRKLAARLKRDFEKLQRDFDHAEQTMSEQTREIQRPQAKSMDSASSMESMTSSQFDSWAWKQTLNSEEGGDESRILRPRATKLKLRIKPRRTETQNQPEGDSAWGSTKFPEFPGEAGPSIGDRLTRLPPRPTFNRLKAKLRQLSPEKSPGRHARVSSTSDYELPVPSPRRAQVSPYRGRHATPKRSTETSRSRSRSTSANRMYDGTPSRRTGSSSKNQTPLRGRYDSISSQLASVRKFVSNSVRSVGMNGARSLGSELGSEYGNHDRDSWDDSAPGPEMTKDRKEVWVDEDAVSGSDGTDGPFCRPISIPANASSGLSSLAMALSSSPVSKKTPRRSPIRSPDDESDPGSYRPKKGRRNWIRPLLLSQRLDTRPAMHPRTSSNGTFALAHRRRKSAKEELYDLVQEISNKTSIDKRERQLELYSPPARLVNDLIILLSVLLEWIEMLIIIIYRVSVAVKYGRESIFRTWRQGRDKRYYL